MFVNTNLYNIKIVAAKDIYSACKVLSVLIHESHGFVPLDYNLKDISRGKCSLFLYKLVSSLTQNQYGTNSTLLIIIIIHRLRGLVYGQEVPFFIITIRSPSQGRVCVQAGGASQLLVWDLHGLSTLRLRAHGSTHEISYILVYGLYGFVPLYSNPKDTSHKKNDPFLYKLKFLLTHN